jgi:hypothetical protein
LDGTASAGRKGIAYLRDYYEPPATADSRAAETTERERTLVSSSAQ